MEQRRWWLTGLSARLPEMLGQHASPGMLRLALVTLVAARGVAALGRTLDDCKRVALMFHNTCPNSDAGGS